MPPTMLVELSSHRCTKKPNSQVAFLSHTFTDTQRRWSTSEQEAYSIYFVIKKLNYYLEGADIIVRNDHKPLARFLNGKNKNTKINRWGLELASYNIKFEWISGAKNKAADCLSWLVELPKKHQKNPNGTKPMLINMVKAVTTRSGSRNTTLVERTKKQSPLRMDINTGNTPRKEVSKETTSNNCKDNSKRYLSKGNAVNGSFLQAHHEKIAQQNGTQTWIGYLLHSQWSPIQICIRWL